MVYNIKNTIEIIIHSINSVSMINTPIDNSVEYSSDCNYFK